LTLLGGTKKIPPRESEFGRAQYMPVFLVNEGGERFHFDEGVTVVGRGTLGIVNKKCSRKQAEIEVLPNNQVYLTAVCT
jgi:hypothetical protein